MEFYVQLFALTEWMLLQRLHIIHIYPLMLPVYFLMDDIQCNMKFELRAKVNDQLV